MITESKLSDFIIKNLETNQNEDQLLAPVVAETTIRKNQRFYFFSSDDEVSWEKRKKEESDHPDVIYYSKNPITYQFNNEGFRSDNFSNTDEGIVTLGCSFTEGVGLHLEHTWGAKLASELNLKHYNISLSGYGLDKLCGLFYYYVNRLKFNNVFLLLPPPYRKSIITKENILLGPYFDGTLYHNLVINTHKPNPQEKDLYSDFKYHEFLVALFFGSDSNWYQEELRSIFTIYGICKMFKKNLFILDSPSSKVNSYKDYSEEFYEDIPHIGARETHPGIREQHHIYLNFLDKFKNNLFCC